MYAGSPLASADISSVLLKCGSNVTFLYSTLNLDNHAVQVMLESPSAVAFAISDFTAANLQDDQISSYPAPFRGYYSLI